MAGRPNAIDAISIGSGADDDVISRRTFITAAAALGAVPALALARAKPSKPEVHARAAIVVEDGAGTVLYAKNAADPLPIASITKLMTAIVVLDAKQDREEPIEILEDDKSRLKWSRSRVRIGSVLARDDLLRLALMASDNRSAAALARTYPGGTDAALDAMNRKAAALGLVATRYADPTGLSPGNVSSAADLAKLVHAACKYPLVRQYSTLPEYQVQSKWGITAFVNTNRLTRGDGWRIDLSKTGFIAEAGHCLVLAARINDKLHNLVFLDAAGRFTPFADAHRVRQWLEPGYAPPANSVRRPAARS